MSIASEVIKLNTNLENCYTLCSNAGATMPAHQNFDNLANCIDTITPVVDDFVGLKREVSADGFYQVPSENFSFVIPSNATKLENYVLYYGFYKSTGLTSVDMSSITAVDSAQSCYYAFYDCTNLASIDLSSLATVTGSQGFYYAFRGCESLTVVRFPSLATVTGNQSFANAFYGCKNLTDIYFNSLTTTSFGKTVNQFAGLLSSTSNKVTHTLHFPSNLETTISGLSGYPLFGGTSGYVVLQFDLTATS